MGIQLFLQTDEKWKNDSMTGYMDFPEMTRDRARQRWGEKGHDSIGRWGCLLTSVCNIEVFRGLRYVTPQMLNETLRRNKGYKVLKEKDFCSIGQESFIEWNILLPLIGATEIRRNVKLEEIEINNPNKYYIARVPFRPASIMTGHYNIIVGYQNGIITHFDSDSGQYRHDWKDNSDYHILEITFAGGIDE